MTYIAFGFTFFCGYVFGILVVALMSANDEKGGDKNDRNDYNGD